jgi:diguanylate cyclase (GGDEF)-like protein
MGVPVMVGGTTKAVFVGYVRLDRSALETYVESIHYGKTGKEYVVDSVGTIVASTDPAYIARSIGQPLAVNAVEQNRSGDYQRNGRLVSYAPFAVGGWSGIAVQSTSEFFGPIRSGELRVESAIIALLAIASVVIAVLGYKREAARRRFQEQLAYQAYHDSLTGLPNRPMLLERLGQALSRARRQGSAVAVLYLDLDRFKQVNDTLGHDAGDAVLVATAARLTSLVRPYDVVARMGGDEFAIVVEDLPVLLALPSARSLAERIIAEVTRPVQVTDHLSVVGVSIGVAVTDTGREDVETILRDADLAMYRAKDSRGDRFIIAGAVESVAQRTSTPQPNS